MSTENKERTLTIKEVLWEVYKRLASWGAKQLRNNYDVCSPVTSPNQPEVIVDGEQKSDAIGLVLYPNLKDYDVLEFNDNNEEWDHIPKENHQRPDQKVKQKSVIR